MLNPGVWYKKAIYFTMSMCVLFYCVLPVAVTISSGLHGLNSGVVLDILFVSGAFSVHSMVGARSLLLSPVLLSRCY